MKTLLLGDVCPTVNNAPLFENGDIDTLFTDTVSLFEESDVNFVNIECAITEHTVKIKKFGPNLPAPPNTAKVLKALGINYAGLSNNHIFDYGIKGALDSMKYLEEAGITCTGFGDNYEDSRRDLVIEKDGERISIITVCEHEYSYALDDRMGSRPYDEYDTIEDIRSARSHSDRVIVLYHGGKEYCRYPSPRLYKACHAMARAGADVILCQHTHCISCYEQYEGAHILYGQGNFHFSGPDFEVPECWNSMLAVSYDTRTHEIGFTPMVNTELGITLAKGEEKEEIMRAFEQRSGELESGEWREGWHSFCLSMAELYKGAIKDACNDDSTEQQNARFGHYLDCEAHTDVWRELFPTYNQTNEK